MCKRQVCIYSLVLGWCKEPPNKAGAGLGRDIGQFSIGFELGYSISSVQDLAVSASLEQTVFF